MRRLGRPAFLGMFSIAFVVAGAVAINLSEPPRVVEAEATPDGAGAGPGPGPHGRRTFSISTYHVRPAPPFNEGPTVVEVAVWGKNRADFAVVPECFVTYGAYGRGRIEPEEAPRAIRPGGHFGVEGRATLPRRIPRAATSEDAFCRPRP